MMRVILSSLALVALFTVLLSTVSSKGGQAQASLTTYSDRPAWSAAVDSGPDAYQDFESFTSDAIFGLGAVDAGPFTIRQSAGIRNLFNRVDVPPYFAAIAPLLSPNGTTFAQLVTSSGVNTTQVQIQFDEPTVGFGADFRAEAPDSVNLDFNEVLVESPGGLMTTSIPTNNGFFGFVSSEPFTRLTFQMAGSGLTLGFGIDNVVVEHAGDSDGDGIPNDEDSCPFEAPQFGLDADNDGCTDTIAGLIALTEGLDLNGLAGLIAKLEAAEDAVSRGQGKVVENSLNAYLAQIEGVRGHGLTEEEANLLVAYAQNLLLLISVSADNGNGAVVEKVDDCTEFEDGMYCETGVVVVKEAEPREEMLHVMLNAHVCLTWTDYEDPENSSEECIRVHRQVHLDDDRVQEAHQYILETETSGDGTVCVFSVTAHMANGKVQFEDVNFECTP